MLHFCSSLSPHNRSVKADLMEKIVSEKYGAAEIKCEFTVPFQIYSCKLENYIVGAVQRRYESVRRQWLVEEKENSADLMEAQAKANKYRARRIRVSWKSHIDGLVMFALVLEIQQPWSSCEA